MNIIEFSTLYWHSKLLIYTISITDGIFLLPSNTQDPEHSVNSWQNFHCLIDVADLFMNFIKLIACTSSDKFHRTLFLFMTVKVVEFSSFIIKIIIIPRTKSFDFHWTVKKFRCGRGKCWFRAKEWRGSVSVRILHRSFFGCCWNRC